MRAASISYLRMLTEGVDITQILTTIGIHDDRGFERRRIGIIPEEELLPVSPECNFD